MKEPALLRLHRRITRWPAGTWLFSRAVCFRAPYFASISPRITVLEPGRCEVRIADRRRVHNHIGTVHAIALCNMAELAAGLMTDVTIPTTMRWIPKGMQVEYLKKAVGPMRAVATPLEAPREAAEGYELPVEVVVTDRGGETVFTARIRMWVSPRR
ncbi:hotdog fold domain-containing protein [Rehaibacterium terrae]|jgi:acyl-coenzyme A thioesterase PaaI-like protein|uniref:Acyl-coenzyme A thioesterase PaaI-like protein n=1 Tax=Rehaibacterium terrae TaxID=1341696 RepID=A0A7W8DDG6_9GAMM|nr:hotdog fold domain-containing protein [Rehaibacterium terrae]MBB5015107.1 acyl-coenzyme A thioesterase PaaI-like protein [Rehaibacterium terrae]